MEPLIRLLRWLNLLLHSAFMDARSHLLIHYRWFRRPEDNDLFRKKKMAENTQRSNQLKKLTMKIRIRLLQWLSLLQLSACLGAQSPKLSHFALFRRT